MLKKLKQWHINKLEQVQKLLNLSNYEILWVVFFEGIVIGNNTTLRDLMGIQKEFYKKLGLTKIKFWPTFFPYTEPSLQTMVYNEKLGKWIELFGMGIFRPEVTKPLGIDKPVLAWGGGIERIAMLKYELDDVREFYNNNLSWLRSA